jgi:hypothetical protein
VAQSLIFQISIYACRGRLEPFLRYSTWFSLQADAPPVSHFRALHANDGQFGAALGMRRVMLRSSGAIRNRSASSRANNSGLITEELNQSIVRAAARSGCGRNRTTAGD